MVLVFFNFNLYQRFLLPNSMPLPHRFDLKNCVLDKSHHSSHSIFMNISTHCTNHKDQRSAFTHLLWRLPGAMRVMQPAWRCSLARLHIQQDALAAARAGFHTKECNSLFLWWDLRSLEFRFNTSIIFARQRDWNLQEGIFTYSQGTAFKYTYMYPFLIGAWVKIPLCAFATSKICGCWSSRNELKACAMKSLIIGKQNISSTTHACFCRN
jgi:hypothetical protein